MITIISESAVALNFGGSISPETLHKVLDFKDWLSEHSFPGLLAAVPAYASLTVFFDPFTVKKYWPQEPSPARAVAGFLEKSLPLFPARQRPAPVLVEISVRYDGPDLPEVAERLQLPENEVIRLHTEPVYTVFMIGFLPGFPYLGPLPKALELPRRDTPRLRVPAGSVAVAGSQTGIYPQPSPGGWHLIGMTDFPLFDPTRRPPALLQAGMQVRFKARG